MHRFSTIPETGMTLPQYAAAGFFSAIPMTAITAPFERIKIVLQIQGQQSSGGQPHYTGGFDALRGIYKQGGLRSGTSPDSQLLRFFTLDWDRVLRGSFSRGWGNVRSRWAWISCVLCRLRIHKTKINTRGETTFSPRHHHGRWSSRYPHPPPSPQSQI